MRLLIRLIMIIVIVAAIAVVSLLMLPSERIAAIAADQISRQTGRVVRMEGETKVTLWPILGISTERFSVANAEWSQAGPMVEAQNLKIGVEPQALWGGEVRITGLEARQPVVRLERAKDGRVNWELGVAGVAPSGQAAEGATATSRRLALTLDRALIEGASLSFIDHAAGQTTQLAGVDMDLRWPDFEGRATFEASLLPLGDVTREALTYADKIQISGHLDQVGGFIDGALSMLEARVEAPGGSVAFTGQVSTLPAAQGNVTASLSNFAQFLAAFGVSGVEIPEGMGRAVSVSTGLTLSDGLNLALRDTVLQLDGNSFNGGADLALGGAKPQVNAQLRAGPLDFSGFAGSDSNNASAGGTGGTGGAVQSGWSKAAIDASVLALLDGEFALVADSIDLGDLKLGKTRTRAALTRSRLVFTIAELQLYDGGMTGEFVINNRSGLSVGGNLAAQGLNIESLLRDAAGISRLSGTAAAQIKFLGVGQTMDAIMKSLSGSGSVSTGRGVISGFDLDRLMRAGDVTGGTTVFDSLTASFTMDGGNLFNNDLLMTLPLAKAEGQGRIGLGAQDLDYLFTPSLLSGENRRGLAIPVRISGPWANPRIKPDFDKAIDLNLEAEKKELEERVKAEREKLEERATKALEKELGVQRDEGQSIEDALEDALKEELGDGLLRLFD